MRTAVGGISLIKSQEDFYRRNKATMDTSRKLNDEAEQGSVDLRYAYKLLPPGSKNFYAKAWEQAWGGDSLMYKAHTVDSKRPTIEKFTLDQPETGSLPTRAPKNGLGSEGLIVSCNVETDGPQDADKNDDEVVTDGEGDNDGLASHIADIDNGDVATGEAGWGAAPGDNTSAIARRPSAGMSALAKTPEGSGSESDEDTEPKAISMRKSPAKTTDPASAGGKGDPTGPKVMKPRAKDYPKAHALASKIIDNDELPEDAEAEIRAMTVKERNRFKKWAVANGWSD